MNESEADARIVINDLLLKAGWDASDKTQGRTDMMVKKLSNEVRESLADTFLNEQVERTAPFQ